MKNIALVDDHAIVRSGLKELIEKLGAYHVVLESSNGQNFIDTLPTVENLDLIMLDLEMPVMDGESTAKYMMEHSIQTPVLVLTLSENEDQIIRLFRYGVRGYLHKNCSAETLKNAITQIFDTGYYHSEMLTKALTSFDKEPNKAENNSEIGKISTREKEFLLLVCHDEEYTYDQIADIMKVHRRTVDGYRESLFEKFSIKSKTGLVLFALRNKLI